MAELLVQNKPTGKSFSVSLNHSRVVVGSADSCDVVLHSAGISPQHCVIYWEDDGYTVSPLGESPVHIDSYRIETDTPLFEGAPLRIGGWVMTLETSTTQKCAASTSTDRRATVQAGCLRYSAASTPTDGQRVPPVRSPKPTTDSMELKRLVQERLLEDKKFTLAGNPSSAEELRKRILQAMAEITRQHPSVLPAESSAQAIAKELMDEMTGLGPLEDLMSDRNVIEIMVNGPDKIFIETSGGMMQKTNRRFASTEHLLETIRRILAPLGRRINETTPMVDARLRDGSRINAVTAPVALGGPMLTIRKFPQKWYSIDDLVRLGALTEKAAQFLGFCVQQRASICISGGVSSGKTTLLNALAGLVADSERIVVAEDTHELCLARENVVYLEAKPANLEGEHEMSLRSLVMNALRMRPDRIIVGECRGKEAFDMLQAINTGNEGSMTTVHANSPRDAMARLENLVLMAATELPSRAIREQLASALNFIVQMARIPGSSQRKVIKVTEITGIEGEVIKTQDIFAYNARANSPLPTGLVPRLTERWRNNGVTVDLTMFH